MYRASHLDGIALVTGASSGIGKAVALELARRGWRVALLARRADALAEVARERPDALFACVCDVTDAAAVKAAVAGLIAEHGRISLAFLNVGTYVPEAAGGFDAASVMATFAINVGGTMTCLEPLIAHMKQQGGQIAVNASIAGYGGLPMASAYGASKAALINFCASQKFALDPANIRMQVVCPGFVRTPLTDHNKFPMPGLVEAGDAGRRICDGFERGGFEITFPRRLSWTLKVLNALPYALYFPLVARATGQGR
ncbi:MAG: SDR family NAD(P)-dependent oxidoreductase [Hyphomicrobiales bacterium]|nr:SDR family NAD(P)-dependent oxidoreductase [Hyphomicrobiales bacterium]